jgi:hypothetical protein
LEADSSHTSRWIIARETTSREEPGDQRRLAARARAMTQLESSGLWSLAQELGPEGSLRWIAYSSSALDSVCATTEELTRIADGESIDQVLGFERAEKVNQLLKKGLTLHRQLFG